MLEIPIPPQKLRFMSEDDASFFSIGDHLLSHALNYVIPSTVLDVGCGYGRFAYALHRRRFGGRYYGLDVKPRHIAWLQENFTPIAPNYQFKHEDIRNGRYNPKGTLSTHDIKFRPGFIPDLTVLASVFTHMYEADIAIYISKLRAVCRSHHSVIFATFFLLSGDQDRRTGIGPFSHTDYPFAYRLNEHCSYFSENDPLHAIAYEEGWLRDLLEREGFECIDVTYGFQDTIILAPKLKS